MIGVDTDEDERGGRNELNEDSLWRFGDLEFLVHAAVMIKLWWINWDSERIVQAIPEYYWSSINSRYNHSWDDQLTTDSTS